MFLTSVARAHDSGKEETAIALPNGSEAADGMVMATCRRLAVRDATLAPIASRAARSAIVGGGDAVGHLTKQVLSVRVDHSAFAFHR